MSIIEINNTSNISAENNNKIEYVTYCKRIYDTALYVLIASEGPIASYAIRAQNLLLCTYHLRQIVIHQKNDLQILNEVKNIGIHTLHLTIDLLSHPVSILYLDGKELIDLTRQFICEISSCNIEFLGTLGQITITIVSIYAKFVPSPEIIVISITLKIARDLGKSFNAFYNGKFIEGIGFIAAAAVRGHVHEKDYRYIHHKWKVLSDPKFTIVWARINEGKNTDFLKGHPMEDLRKAIEDGSEIHLLDDQGNVMNLGAHFSNIGGELVKDMHLTGRIRKLSHHELIELRFKVTRVYRERVQAVINEYKNYNPEKINEFLRLAGVAEGVAVTVKPFQFYQSKKGGDIQKEVADAFLAHDITFEGLGNIQIGKLHTIHGLYKNVTASVDGNAEAKDMHMLLSLAGMGQAIVPSTPEEITRMKIGILYRTFYPTNAIALQRTPSFFELPLEKLVDKMVQTEPKMKTIIKNKLPFMTQDEIQKGWLKWKVPGLSDEVVKAGGMFLAHEIYGNIDIGERVASILKMGLLSTMVRFDSGQSAIQGLSSISDIVSGGADTVFTRLKTAEELQREGRLEIDSSNGISFLIGFDSLEGCYQYHTDNYGNKGDDYLKHDDILTFTKTQKDNPTFGNEVMLPHTVTPNHFHAIVVSSQTRKELLVESLRKQGLISDQNGVEYCNGKELDSFIITADESAALINKLTLERQSAIHA